MAAFLAMPQVAQSDGCYIPLRAYQKIPEITGQRALVVWKDGVETLVVSSALDSESQKLGWIIPVPAVPETIEQETPGLLRTLSFLVQPRITNDLLGEVSLVFWVAFLTNLVLAVALFRQERLFDLLILIVVTLVLSTALFSASGTGGVSPTRRIDNVRVEKSVSVGAYDICVLRAQHAEDLDDWLRTNGFVSLPAQAGQPVRDYIRDGWVFAAIKFVRAEAGANAPHPIRLSFRTPDIVYPLKLTALAGGKPSFELFVVANERVRCTGLQEEFCDRFARTKFRDPNASETKDWDAFAGKVTKIQVEHPAICRRMWDECVLTKFSGTIAARAMTQDLRFTPAPFAVRQQHLYTRQGAFLNALLLWIGLLGAGLFFSLIICARRIRQARYGIWYCTNVVLPVVVLAGFCAGVAFLVAPKLPQEAVHVRFRWHAHGHVRALEQGIALALEKNPDVLTQSPSAIAAYLLTNSTVNGRHVVSGISTNRPTNYVSGEDLRVEDSPGNFTVERRETNLVIRIYGERGCPMEICFPVTPAGTTTQ